MIKICVALKEGHGQYNEHVMHSHVWDSHRVKFDDNDFNSFPQTHTELRSSTLKFAGAYDFVNRNQQLLLHTPGRAYAVITQIAEGKRTTLHLWEFASPENVPT